VFLSQVAGTSCDTDRRRQVADLTVSRAEKIGGAQASIARALEQAAQCIALVERVRPALRRVLRMH
jgi:DNA-binding FrmR family transcriptional regulator